MILNDISPYRRPNFAEITKIPSPARRPNFDEIRNKKKGYGSWLELLNSHIFSEKYPTSDKNS